MNQEPAGVEMGHCPYVFGSTKGTPKAPKLMVENHIIVVSPLNGMKPCSFVVSPIFGQTLFFSPRFCWVGCFASELKAPLAFDTGEAMRGVDRDMDSSLERAGGAPKWVDQQKQTLGGTYLICFSQQFTDYFLVAMSAVRERFGTKDFDVHLHIIQMGCWMLEQ